MRLGPAAVYIITKFFLVSLGSYGASYVSMEWQLMCEMKIRDSLESDRGFATLFREKCTLFWDLNTDDLKNLEDWAIDEGNKSRHFPILDLVLSDLG